MDWSHTHNTRNFSKLEGDSACIWECRDNHLGSIFALTRKVEGILTCSCGFPGSFLLGKMVDPEFCDLFHQEMEVEDDYYNVNCVTDLDDDGGDGGVDTLVICPAFHNLSTNT